MRQGSPSIWAGPEWLKARAAEMNLVEGARCSETVNGTNGVGTALAADHPVQVFAFEHFSYHHREWVCSGAPIHDLVSGRLMGIIDLSSPWKIAHPRSLELVTAAARTTEQCLLESRRDQDARLRRRYGDLTTKTSDLLVNREGYVLIGDDWAHPKQLEIPENGGEIAIDDGSLAVAEPLGRGEAYLVRRPGPHRATAARGEGLERAEERARELARKRDARARACDPEHAGEVASDLPSPSAGKRLGAYLEAAIDCVIVADASGRIVEFNPAAERTFGYSREEALGRTMAELIVPPALRERHIAAFARFVKSGEGSMLGRRVELTGMRADGSEFPVELALSLVEGEPVLICGALRDISATKQAERHLRELAEEQAALRHVATLVAYESSPERLVAVVAEQVARVFDVPLVRLIRYEPTDAVVVGGFSESDDEPFATGSRWQLDTPGLLATIRHTGRSARVEDYGQAPGDGAGAVRAAGMRSAVGSPIVAAGRVWGAIVLLSPRSASLPEDTGARLADFTDLVATALANAESRAALSQLADEQAALRRVATLVAREASPVELLETVAREVARVLNVEAIGILRFEPDETATLVAQSDTPWDPPPLGTRFTLEGENVVTAVFRTREAARLDDWAKATGPVAEMARVLGIRSSVATPIVVEGRLWGTLIAVSSQSDPIPPETDSRIGEFTELVATAIANAGAREELSASEARARDLAAEQAALRRVATLVARGASSDELFAAVAGEAADVLRIPVVGVHRFEGDGTFTVMGVAGKTSFTVGGRWPVEDEGVAGMILATGRPARKDDYTTMSGPLGAAMRDDAMISTVGVPIVVEGAIWGFMVGVANAGTPIPDDTEKRFGRFTALVATAIANTNARLEVSRMAYEQAALRRVATMVARAPAPDQLFSAIAREVASVLDVPGVIVTRYEPDGTAVTLGEAFGPDLDGANRFLGVGTPMPPDPGTLTARVFDTHGSARVDDLSTSPGATGEVARAAQLGSGCAGPIVVNGKLWGKMCVFSRAGTVLPGGTESRLHDFIELIVTAIANYEARADLAASEARARELADEQAALRRVATLVARGVRPEEIFSAVTNEMAQLFGSPQACVGRFEGDGSAMVVVGVSDDIRGISIGSRWELEDYMASTGVLRTGRPVRVERSDFEHASGRMADVLREIGAVSNVGAPIVVEGKQWGFVTVTDVTKRLPADAEKRLQKFAELLATAIANADSRAELAASEARARKLADEQASLRRVATLVAEGPAPTEVFDAVIAEVGQLLGAAQIGLARYENEHEISVLAIRGQSPDLVRPGVRLPLDGDSVNARILRTGRSARVNFAEEGSGSIAEVLRRDEVNATVGAPIVVDGAVWGMIGASWRGDDQPAADAEERLAQFAELLATAVSNTVMRSELAASRARVIAAADESRRRIERDLHDGAQQQLVTLAVALRRAQAKIPSELEEVRADVGKVADGLAGAVNDLRDLSRGIHPAILTEGGLSPALKALGRRSEVRVKLEVGFEERLPDRVEVAAYYIVSEALTNASKHANATRVWVSLQVEHDVLLLSVRDDGDGGADPNRGSGLTGLRDRIEALGGRIKIESPSGSGTLIEVEIPIAGPADRDREPDKVLAQATMPGSPG